MGKAVQVLRSNEQRQENERGKTNVLGDRMQFIKQRIDRAKANAEKTRDAIANQVRANFGSVKPYELLQKINMSSIGIRAERRLIQKTQLTQNCGDDNMMISAGAILFVLLIVLLFRPLRKRVRSQSVQLWSTTSRVSMLIPLYE